MMNRRNWIRTAALATAATGVRAAELRPPIIDTHTHFYDPTRPEGIPWPPQDSALYRKVLPKDWEAVANPVGVTQTVVVEASPWVEDNQWILDQAKENPCIVGLVGNLDPLADEFETLIKRFATDPLFIGLRWRSKLMTLDQDLPRLKRAARIMADHNLSLDLNGPNAVADELVQIAEETPELRIVLNHVAGAGDPRKLTEAWKTRTAELAAFPQVHMKVSGMLEQVRLDPGEAPTEVDFYRPILDHLWTAFGEDRLIYGSNWPVSDRGGPYAKVFEVTDGYFAEKGAAVQRKVFTDNARRVYRAAVRDL